MLNWIATFLGVTLLVFTWHIVRSHERLQRTVDKQQDTIQRLINREPVTYAEVNAEPPTAAREFYSAWGGETIDAKDIE
jgi:hypothetical protein